MAVINSVIDGKYEILKLVGQGGMSKVYLAMDKRLKKQWAVKEIEKRARDKNNEIVLQSAIAEANMIKRLDHPYLPRIVDIIDNGNIIYVVMDFIEGEPLSKVLEHYGAQPQDIVIEWAKQLCEVLDYLHTRQPSIIYRDMKPGNVMLHPDGDIKLIDFGIAREYKEKNTEDTVSLGTKGYAAPEQFGGKGQTDARTDVYCLGATLYHLVTGHNPAEPPYEMYPIRHWNAGLSSGLERIIQKCTQLNPDDRYQSCAELLYALDRHEEADDQYRKKQKKKLSKFMGTAVAFLLFLIIGITGQVMRIRTDNLNYDKLIQDAEKTSSISEKIDIYSSAVDIKPGETRAYLGLIESFKDDANFTLDEEEIFLKKIIANMEAIKRNKEDYADLTFETGKLYLYYYSYGNDNSQDNWITRMKAALPWFEDAVRDEEGNEYEHKGYYNMAKIYKDIGDFHQNITLWVTEASDATTYGMYWNRMKDLMDTVGKNPGESELVRLQVYRLTLNSIEDYAEKFQLDGVDESDVRELYNEACEGTKQIGATTDVTAAIRMETIERFALTERSIDTAYARKQGTAQKADDEGGV